MASLLAAPTGGHLGGGEQCVSPPQPGYAGKAAGSGGIHSENGPERGGSNPGNGQRHVRSDKAAKLPIEIESLSTNLYMKNIPIGIEIPADVGYNLFYGVTC